MNRLAIASLLAAAAVGAQAETYIDNARVRGVDPQYENISIPRNECTSQWISEPRQIDGGHQYGGAVIGGIAGGVLGRQVGRGSGRDAATAVGAVVGALTGDHLGNRNRVAQYDDGQREVQRCRTVNDVQSRITGYRVNYDYRGQQFTTFMRQNPGPNLQVRVSVEPIEQ